MNRTRHLIRSFRLLPSILGGLILCLAGASPVTAQLYSHGDPTAEEQLMLELVNRARLNPAGEAARLGIDLNEGLETNTISPAPKQPLAFNSHLIQAARGHSQWMLDHDTFDHFETGNIGPAERMSAAGYQFTGSFALGENLSFRGTTGTPLPVGSAVAKEHDDLFIDIGIEDRGHRVNLMTDEFRDVGLGVGVGIYTDNGQDFNAVMTTQDFGATGANPGPFVAGVAYRDTDGNKFYSPGEGLAGINVMPAGGANFAVTSTSGGYAVPVTGLSGSVVVTFSGGPLSAPVTKLITLSGANVKLDFEANADLAEPFGFVVGSAHSGNGHFEVDLFGPANTALSIEASEDLNVWSKIGDVTLGASPTHFSDAQASGTAFQFYRALKR